MYLLQPFSKLTLSQVEQSSRENDELNVATNTVTHPLNLYCYSFRPVL